MAGTIAHTAHWGIMAEMAAVTASITDPLTWKCNSIQQRDPEDTK